ncbi:MAG: lactonase family protein [Limisphaerales bacterium]
MKFVSKLTAALAICVALTGCDTIQMPASKTSAAASNARGVMWVYFGTYTKRESKGIYVARLDLKTGALSALSTNALAAESVNPSFLAIHPAGDKLYAVNEIADYNGEKAGAVSAFRINTDSGALELINQQSSKGGGPCHLVVDSSGQNVLLANYGGGSVAALPIADDGSLKPASTFVQHQGSSVNPRRQKGPHGHSINVDPGNKFAVAADLGLDKLLVYRFDAGAGTLVANNPPSASVVPGAGPRHFAFHGSGKFAYVINELNCTVTAFNYDAEAGTLTELQTVSTLDVPQQKGFSTAEVQVHPSGRFLYGSNRGHDSIAVFTINQSSGRLTQVQVQPSGGTTPRNFGIDPTGQYLLAAGQNSDNVAVFRIDPNTGRITPTGHELEVPTPVCVKFLAR